MNKVFATIIAIVLAMPCMAQSQKRLQEEAAKKEAEKSPTAVTLSQRARSQYTAQTAVPEEVTWRRDIYRELDLRKEKNAALYYPERPLGDRVNFFTLVFNLILDGRIKAYEYGLDGNERFSNDNLLDIENMLKKSYIDYTRDSKDTSKFIVAMKDIPSNEIGKYYIKESNYLDQMSNYHTKVTAICPVMVSGEPGNEEKKPMFWLNYDEISPYLGQTPVMTSSFNNTSNMSLDDYFVMGCYDGDIYKTSNLRNTPLMDYCDTDSALNAERQNIEDQLSDFQSGLWNEKQKKAQEEAKAQAAADDRKSANSTKEEKQPREKKEKEPKPERAPKPSSSGERIGVHR